MKLLKLIILFIFISTLMSKSIRKKKKKVVDADAAILKINANIDNLSAMDCSSAAYFIIETLAKGHITKKNLMIELPNHTVLKNDSDSLRNAINADKLIVIEIQRQHLFAVFKNGNTDYVYILQGFKDNFHLKDWISSTGTDGINKGSYLVLEQFLDHWKNVWDTSLSLDERLENLIYIVKPKNFQKTGVTQENIKKYFKNTLKFSYALAFEIDLNKTPDYTPLSGLI